MGWVVNATTPAALSPGKGPVRIVQEAGWAPGAVWTGAGNLVFNPSNLELNPICHLLALLGAHHILHVSR